MSSRKLVGECNCPLLLAHWYLGIFPNMHYFLNNLLCICHLWMYTISVFIKSKLIMLFSSDPHKSLWDWVTQVFFIWQMRRLYSKDLNIFTLGSLSKFSLEPGLGKLSQSGFAERIKMMSHLKSIKLVHKCKMTVNYACWLHSLFFWVSVFHFFRMRILCIGCLTLPNNHLCQSPSY